MGTVGKDLHHGPAPLFMRFMWKMNYLGVKTLFFTSHRFYKVGGGVFKLTEIHIIVGLLCLE